MSYNSQNKLLRWLSTPKMSQQRKGCPHVHTQSSSSEVHTEVVHQYRTIVAFLSMEPITKTNAEQQQQSPSIFLAGGTVEEIPRCQHRSTDSINSNNSNNKNNNRSVLTQQAATKRAGLDQQQQKHDCYYNSTTNTATVMIVSTVL